MITKELPRFLKILTALAVLASGLFSCTRADADLRAPEGDVITLSVGQEEPSSVSDTEDASVNTRTYVQGSKIQWSSSGSYDKVLFVFDTKGVKNKFTSSSTKAEAVRSFSGTISEGSKIKFVLWSGKTASSDQSTLSGDIISGDNLSVPATQNIANTNSFAPTSNIAVMKPGDNKMRSVMGYLRYTIPADANNCATIKSVKFEADEDLVGNIRIDYSGSEPVATIVSGGSKSVTVTTRYQTKIPGYEPGNLYAVVAPGVYHNMKITVTPFKNGASDQNAEAGEPFTLTVKNPVTVVRGKYTNAGALPNVKPEPVTPDEGCVLDTLNMKHVFTGSCMSVWLEGNTLYTGTSGKIMVYDITTPMSPVLKKEVEFPGSPRQIQAYNGKLYVTARATGVWIFDISSPQNPSLISRFDSIELATGLEIAGNCMFVGQRQNGVEFVDVSDPTRPQHIHAFKTNESQSVVYTDGYLYSGEWGAGKITIFKCDNLANIQNLGTVNLWGVGDGVTVRGNRLYASTGHNAKNGSPRIGNSETPYSESNDGKGHGVEIWDISNKAAPSRISRVDFDIFYLSGTDCWTNRPSGDGKTLFCGDVYNGLYVVDITDETEPKIIAKWCEWHKPKGQNYPVTCVAPGDGVLYMTLGSSGGGLYAIPCSRANRQVRDKGTLPTNESYRYNYTTSSSSKFNAWKPTRRGAVRAAIAYGDVLFVGCGQAGLATVKMGTDGKPYAVNEMDIPFAGGVAIKGNRLYVSEGEKGVGVYKIGTDSNCTLTRECYILDALYSKASGRYSCWLSIPNDNYLASANRDGGWQFVNIGGTSAAPTYTFRKTLSENVNYNKYIAEKVCTGNKLAYATRNGLCWIDLSSTSSVSYTVNKDLAVSLSEGATEFKNGSALFIKSGYFKTIEGGASTVSETSSAKMNSGIPRWDGGDKILVCHYLDFKASLFNVSSVTNATKIFEETTTGHPEPGTFWNGKAVVPCGYQGLLVEK